MMKWQKFWLQASLIGLTFASPGAVLAQSATTETAAKPTEAQERLSEAALRTYSYLDMIELGLALSETYEQSCNRKVCSPDEIEGLVRPLLEKHPGGAFMLENNFKFRPHELREVLGDASFIGLNKALLAYSQALEQIRGQAVPDRSSLEAAWKTASGQEDTGSSRALKSSVKANMHTLQTIVETYAVDWGGVYPESLAELKAEANAPGRAYWRDVTNPYSRETGIGGSMLDFAAYRPMPWAKGMAIYEPVIVPGQPVITYRIYGSDEAGQFIQDKQQDFYLSNS